MNLVRWGTPIRTALVVVVVSMAAAIAYLSSNDWFGAGDLLPFVVWSSAFAAYIVIAGGDLLQRLHHKGPRERVPLAAVYGFGLGFLWTLSLALLLPWFGAFSFPVLYFWMLAGAVGLSTHQPAGRAAGAGAAKKGQGRRRLWQTLASVVALPPALIIAVTAGGILITLGSAFVWSHGESEIHLIPEGFVGHVNILYGLVDGEVPEYAGEDRVYRIGSDGVFRTQMRPNEGTSWATTFYYVSPDGRRSEITERWHSTIADTPDNRAARSVVGIYFQHHGTYGPKSPDCTVQTSGYYVGTKADVLSNRGPDALHEHLDMRPLPCDTSSAAVPDA